MKNTEKTTSTNTNTNTNTNRERALALVKAAGSERAASVQALVEGGFVCLEEGHDVTVYHGGEKVCRLAALRKAAGVQAAKEVTGGGTVAKVNFEAKVCTIYESSVSRFECDFTDAERQAVQELAVALLAAASHLQDLFDEVNSRVAAAAKERAAKERAAAKGRKAAERLDNDMLLQVLIAKGIDEQAARALLAC